MAAAGACAHDRVAGSCLGSAEWVDPFLSCLQACFGDSDCITPIIFVLSPAADPMTDLMNLAAQLEMSDKLFSVSLGQGQGACVRVRLPAC